MPLLIACILAVAVDGDTIFCNRQRIRLASIETPERGEPGFDEAKSFMATLVDGRRVTCSIRARDVYGRMVGECGTSVTPDLSAAMLASGLAGPYRGHRK